jgi:hypothetical protein
MVELLLTPARSRDESDSARRLSSAGRAACAPASPRARFEVCVLLTALVALCSLFAALPVARAAVWTGSPERRVYPTTTPGTQHAASLAAAGGEYRGLIIGLRGSTQRAVSVMWSADSDPLLVQNATLRRVAFVRISRPTTGTGAKPGLYPDPLLPRSFGQPMTVPAGSSSLYVLFHVPFGTPAGTYAGTMQVTNGGERVDVPLQLRVWSFGWQRLSTRTGFLSNFRTFSCGPLVAAAMLKEHGVTPIMPKVVPRTAANGDIAAASYANALRPYLATDGLDLATARLPWLNWSPSYPWRLRAGDTRLLNYLTQVCRVYRDNGWQSKAVAYPVDEPTSTATERKVEALARTLHRASARVGYRAKFFVTDDPRPTTLHALLPANRFLWDDVDIWCVRYYYFFGRVPVLRQRQARGAGVWWYPYFNSSVAKLPNFVIEKPLADQRVWGWLMYQWNVNGMLYWGVNSWVKAGTHTITRDPYRDPLSFAYPDGRVANGEASLVYPGYYPRYGLDDPAAPPVSSLRLEALRDGFQDREYLTLATKLLGASYVRSVVKSVTWYPYRIRYGHVFEFPKYATSPSVFDAARGRLAQRIEQALATP